MIRPATIRTEALDAKTYHPYGDVLAARADVKSSPANQGTAKRYDRLGTLENLRSNASANLCVFRSSPFTGAEFEIKLLERHEFSTQLFVPMSCARTYLVIVALGKDEPDPSTLKAFIATREQGITYRPGVWHHPLIALDETADFACVVHEDGSAGDCQVVKLKTRLYVSL